MAPTPSPVLTFTARETRLVSIHGTNYVIRHPDDFSLSETVNLRRLAARFRVLTTKGPSTTADEDLEYVGVVERLAALAVDAPPEALALLAVGEKVGVVSVAFFHVPPTLLMEVAAGAFMAPQATPKPPTKSTRRRGKKTSSRD